tara:strand:- start:190 stop:402 length:213 start_codon:yes stop_codon:yes gene_type:complete
MIEKKYKEKINEVVKENINKLSVNDISLIKYYFDYFKKFENDFSIIFISRVVSILADKKINLNFLLEVKK